MVANYLGPHNQFHARPMDRAWEHLGDDVALAVNIADAFEDPPQSLSHLSVMKQLSNCACRADGPRARAVCVARV